MVARKNHTTPDSAVRHCIRSNPPEKIAFDFEFRVHYYPANLKQFSERERRQIILLGTRHFDGYEREKYLRHLLDSETKPDLNFLLHRLLDWVPEIVARTVQWFKTGINLYSAQEFLDNFPILHRLRHRDSDSYQELLGKIEGLIWEASAPALKQNQKQFSLNQRNYIYRLAQRYLKPEDQLPLLLRESSPQLRRKVLTYIPHEILVHHLDHLLVDKSTAIRHYALRQIIHSDAPDRESVLRKGLLDPGRKIRELAAYYLQELYQIDSYTEYKTRYADHPGLLDFLADRPRKEDESLFLQGLQSDRKANQLAALKALIALNSPALQNLDWVYFFKMNRRFRTTLHRALPRILTFSELKKHDSAFKENPAMFLRYLALLESSSAIKTVNYVLHTARQDTSLPEKADQLIDRHILKNARLYIAPDLLAELWVNWQAFRSLSKLTQPLKQQVDFALGSS